MSLVEVEDITRADVSQTGMSADALRASLAGEGALLRVELRLLGEDPRIALREQRPSQEEIATILARLHRVDAAADTPWTARYLRLIAGQPATVARVLAAQADAEVILFKRRVRQLKELGLTESLEVGYRISPRGEAVLGAL